MTGDPLDPPDPSAISDSEIQREAMAGRKFTLGDAIGRAAGPGHMKGASPISRRQQAGAEIKEYLHRHLPDATGALTTVLLRQAEASDLMLHGFEEPQRVLVDYVRRVLDSEYHMVELVREADVEWGRIFEERPHFDSPDSPPAADDPYTMESVRDALTRLLGALAGEQGPSP